MSVLDDLSEEVVGSRRRLAALPAGQRSLLVRGGSVLALVGSWWLLSLFFETIILPGPGPVFAEMAHIVRHERFLFHLSRTIFRVLTAFGIALVLATAVGIVMGLDSRADRFFETFVLVGLTLPALAVSIIVLLVVGFTNAAGILAIVIVIGPPMTENVREGTKNLDRDLLKMGQVFEADRWMVLTDVILPQLVPYLLAATRFGLGMAWKIVVIVEWIGLGNGIGQQLRNSFDVFSLTGVMAWTLAFVLVMGIIEFGVIKRVERRLTRWHGDEDVAGVSAIGA